MQQDELEYAGFWIRVGASLIDTALLMLVSVPLMFAFYGSAYFEPQESTVVAGPAEILVTWVLPAVAVILFWIYRQATPGKMMVGARIVDAASGKRPGTGQLIGRYLGYIVATLPLGLGILWVAFDRRKQGWHDKLAGTVVVRERGRAAVKFDRS